MCSERRKQANQRNAQKSTGPKTEEGKEQSRRNAVKHGLTGKGEVLPIEDQALYDERMRGWTVDERPESDVQQYLLHCVVLASVRIDRCARNEFAAIARLRRQAVGHWEGHQTRQIEEIAANLEEEPAETVAVLARFARGCEWLLDRWEELRQSLTHQRYWSTEETEQAIRMLGYDPTSSAGDSARVNALRVHAIAVQPEIAPAAVDALLGSDASALDPMIRLVQAGIDLPSAATSRAHLRRTLTAEVRRLEALRDQLWLTQDGPSLAEAINLATFDRSPTGDLRRRYGNSSSLELHRNLNQLAKRHKDAQKEHESRANHNTQSAQSSTPRKLVDGKWVDPTRDCAERSADDPQETIEELREGSIDEAPDDSFNEGPVDSVDGGRVEGLDDNLRKDLPAETRGGAFEEPQHEDLEASKGLAPNEANPAAPSGFHAVPCDECDPANPSDSPGQPADLAGAPVRSGECDSVLEREEAISVAHESPAEIEAEEPAQTVAREPVSETEKAFSEAVAEPSGATVAEPSGEVVPEPKGAAVAESVEAVAAEPASAPTPKPLSDLELWTLSRKLGGWT
jgi:hypothetical protein